MERANVRKKSHSRITISVGVFNAWFITSFSWFIPTSVRMGIRSLNIWRAWLFFPLSSGNAKNRFHSNNFQSNASNHQCGFFSFTNQTHDSVDFFFYCGILHKHSNESKTNDLKFIIIYRNLLHIIQINRLFTSNWMDEFVSAVATALEKRKNNERVRDSNGLQSFLNPNIYNLQSSRCTTVCLLFERHLVVFYFLPFCSFSYCILAKICRCCCLSWCIFKQIPWIWRNFFRDTKRSFFKRSKHCIGLRVGHLISHSLKQF